MPSDDSTDSKAMDLRLIPEFDGTSQAVEGWLEKVELVCKLRGITDTELHTVVPLRLSGGAFSVYQQLNTSDKASYSKIKAALISAFAVDKYVAYEQFITRRLQDSEAVDVYLADLRRLATLFGGISDAGLSCAFVAGLPGSVSRILRAGSRLEDMDVTQILNRARAVLAEEGPREAAAAALSRQSPRTSVSTGIVCRECKQPNHYARDCLVARGGRRRDRGNVRCYGCGQLGHIIAHCPTGNGAGEVAPALATSLDYHQ